MARMMWLTAAAFGVFALLTGCGGSVDSTTAQPQGGWAYLAQDSPGDAAVIRLRLENPSIPLDDQIFAWLFFRSANQRYFSMTADRLVDAVFESTLPNGIWDDGPEARPFTQVSQDFTWLTRDGEETGTIELAYSDPALQPGITYYHRVRRVVEPLARAGGGSPIAAATVTPLQNIPLINVDPPDALSEGSNPTEGVTYFTPPVLDSPPDGSTGLNTRSIVFRWSATVGADEYVLQVFPDDDPSGLRNPQFQFTLRQTAGGLITQEIEGPFAASERFYWRVGARRSGEALPVTARLNLRGWLFSDMRTFTTAMAPPAPPG